MATCKHCGSEFSVWNAPLGAGMCNICSNAQQKERAEVEKKTQEEKWQEEYVKKLQAERVTVSSDTASIPEPVNIVETLTRRYSDAYTEANVLVGVGKIIKGVGAVLATIILIGGVAVTSSSSNPNVAVAGIGFALACFVGIPIYILGILVSALGQMQLATLDTAVNNSRHLQNDDVAQILSKKFRL